MTCRTIWEFQSFIKIPSLFKSPFIYVYVELETKNSLYSLSMIFWFYDSVKQYIDENWKSLLSLKKSKNF